MAKTKQKKQDEIKMLADKLSKMKIGVLTSYTGLKVKDLNMLRQELRKDGINYQAAKKSLLKMAFQESKLPEVDWKGLNGSIAVAFGDLDEVLAPKVLEKFKKDHDQLQILGGIYNGEFIGKDKVVALSKIPGKQELLTQLVWTMKAPISNFSRVLNANLQGLVQVLNQIKEKAT
jgi:large subunit ribosomal protein L10